jgi:hypothetical protein
MKSKLIRTAIFLLAVLFGGCTKDSISTTLNYSFSLLNQGAVVSTVGASGTPIAMGTNGSINWTSASLNIAKVEFSAVHAGKTASFESKNLFGINPFKADSLSGSITIPLGVYENLRFKLTLNESPTNPPIVLNGTYIEVSGTKIPVIVTLNSAQSFIKEASRIEVSTGTYVAKVKLELNAMVKGLMASDFGQTTRTGVNNTILVNSTTNRALFEKLSARIVNTMSVSVVKK